jgi:hypothetical protein
MTFRSNDLAFMFAAFGVTVEYGFSSAKGIFDQPEVIRLADHGFGGVEATNPSIKLPFNAFDPMPSNLDSLIVDGRTYTVLDHTADGDGAIITFMLKGPTS